MRWAVPCSAVYDYALPHRNTGETAVTRRFWGQATAQSSTSAVGGGPCGITRFLGLKRLYLRTRAISCWMQLLGADMGHQPTGAWMCLRPSSIRCRSTTSPRIAERVLASPKCCVDVSMTEAWGVTRLCAVPQFSPTLQNSLLSPCVDHYSHNGYCLPRSRGCGRGSCPCFCCVCCPPSLARARGALHKICRSCGTCGGAAQSVPTRVWHATHLRGVSCI